MRVSVRRTKTLSRPTQVDFDMTSPVLVQRGQLRLLVAWLRKQWRRIRPAPPPRPRLPAAKVGHLARYNGRDSQGRLLFDLVETPTEAIVYDLPMVVVPDDSQEDPWYSSPVEVIGDDPGGRPVRVETSHSEYEISYLD